MRPKESWLLEVRMADHYSEFNVGIMCLIPSHHRAGLVRKLFHYSETLFFVVWKFMRKLENSLTHTRFFTEKKNKQWVCLS